VKNVAIGVATFVIVLLVVIVLRTRRGFSMLPSNSSQSTPAEAYVGLRNMILHGPREKLNLPATSRPTEPWGVVMDFAVSHGTVTVTSLSDGNASIYLSSGGGYLGGVGKPAIHSAAQNFVRTASEFQAAMNPAAEFPLPERGQVSFYVLTDAGVFTGRAAEEELRQRHHPLTKLFAAGQEVITQYRLDQEVSRH
jgi:hypothetical protein